jgi:peptidyl-prolyl cis-trans isomerase B (cyclophilin B)
VGWAHWLRRVFTRAPARPPAHAPGSNIVFGRVVGGMSTVGAAAAVPTFGPSSVGNAAAFNALANALGDERAGTVRRKYGKPLKAVVILGATAAAAT